MLTPSRGTLLLVSALLLTGCSEKPTIRQYTIPGNLPDVLVTSDRMLGAIIPQPSAVWFIKVVGPAAAIESAAADIRRFASNLKFSGDGPDLSTLPTGWNRGGEKPMRDATLLVDTPEAQLDISISQLSPSADWDEQVAMNVNRWRGQLKLPSSSDKWAGGEAFDVTADTGGREAVWVDLTGQMGAASSTSMAGSAPAFAEVARSTSQSSDEATVAEPPKTNSGIKFEKPDSWRAGKMSMMRLEAFSIGPEDQAAELTIIQAGGDLRGNVARWLGQVRGDSLPDDVVDQAMEAAETLQVSGREAKRYYLRGNDAAETAQMIDATIVPMEEGMSIFIKATGPAKTIQAEKERIGEFIRSLELP